MSNSNLYGHRDRRIPTEPIETRVRDAFNEIYQEAGFTPSNKTGDPDSQYELESQSYERGVRALAIEDRRMINTLVDELALRLGKGTGRGTALQILARMGVFFAMRNYGR